MKTAQTSNNRHVLLISPTAAESLGLELAKEPMFLVCGLEAPMPKLGRGVDELELYLLQGQSRGLLQQELAKGHHPLLGAGTTALDHQVVAFDNTIVGEATHGSNVLLSPANNQRSVTERTNSRL
jgi:hypothetical protein